MNIGETIEGKFINLYCINTTPKTLICDVRTKGSETDPANLGESLGTIKWFSRWRKYCFFPGLDTIYEEDCLRQIASWCEDLTIAHKMKVT